MLLLLFLIISYFSYFSYLAYFNENEFLYGIEWTKFAVTVKVKVTPKNGMYYSVTLSRYKINI